MMTSLSACLAQMSDFSALTAAILEFRDARDWRQFHTLRNLIVSLNLEASELLELTQWKSDAEIDALPSDEKSAEALRDECADILLYLLLIEVPSVFRLPRGVCHATCFSACCSLHQSLRN